jgi:hypothetical protein
MYEQYPYGPVTSMQAEGQRHVMEYTDATEFANGTQGRHRHIMRGVTGPAIATSNGSHYHVMRGLTSWVDDHYHCYCVNTSAAIPASNGLHVHVFQGQTTLNDGHVHSFNKTTLSIPLSAMIGPAVP